MDTSNLMEKFLELKRKVELLMQKRIYQQDIIPDAVKQRHMSEGNRYFIAGIESDRPEGNSVTSSVTCYFATDTNKLYLWNGTAWVSVTLS